MPPRRAFWPAVAIVLVAHAVVLTQLAASPEHAPRGGRAAVPVLQVRPVLVGAPASTLPALPGPTMAASQGPSATSEQAPATGQAPPPDAAAAAPPAPAAPPADPWAGYLPRGELTDPPRPIGSVHVPFPPGVEGVVDLKVRISLFIDEAGVVRRVRLDTPDVPPMFARTVVELFERTRFSPGRQGAEAVRSQLRLEVEFDAGTRRRS